MPTDQAGFMRFLAIDPEYQQILRSCMLAEEQYTLIKSKLSPSEQNSLDHYISLCEELDHRKLVLLLQYYK